MAYFDERIIDARRNYVDAALAEMNAVCNLIQNPDNDKHDDLRTQAEQLGFVAQTKYFDFVRVAYELHPTNPALADYVELLTASDNEN